MLEGLISKDDPAKEILRDDLRRRERLPRPVELVHDAATHHEAYALELGDVVKRARGDRDEIRVLARLERADAIGPLEQGGGIDRRRPDRGRRRCCC